MTDVRAGSAGPPPGTPRYAVRRRAQGGSLNRFDQGVYRYLADGRLFVRRDDGDITDADAFERRYATHLLWQEVGGTRDLLLGLEVPPPAES